MSALCVMCITLRFMELWAILFAGCGKAVLAFPHPVNGAVHSGMECYAHFHGAFLFLKPFEQRLPTRGVVMSGGVSQSLCKPSN